MNKNQAMLRPYYKYEVAKLYKISRDILMYWIKTDENFYEKLEETGYKNSQHIFTLKQVEIIFDYLGHPPAINQKEVIKTNDKVSIIPYSKFEISKMYGISSKTLTVQINSIPNEKVIKEIMDGNDRNIYVFKKTKKIFKKNEVMLIFKYLGHPYIYEKTSC